MKKVLFRYLVGALGLALALIAFAPSHTALAQQFSPAAPKEPSVQAEAIVTLARKAMAEYSLKAVILRVTIGGKEVVTEALGESMANVPVTEDMHFRNGAVAISYVATLLLQLVDQGVISLDDTLTKWLPDLPDSEHVTLRMLANMTAGYPDYIQDGQFIAELYADPFRQWTPQELIEIGVSKPRVFEPGTNWDYSHTNYVILGQVLEKITGKPLASLMQEKIFIPLGLKNTDSSSTPAIREPVLHAFSSERREALGTNPATPLYEESTYWNPSWTLAQGAVQTTNIYDMTATAVAIGTGSLVSPEGHQFQISPELLGFGSPLKGCPNCHRLSEMYNYGLGVVLSGSWILQNPLFGGYGALEAYLPSEKIAIAVVTTYGEESFDEEGNYKYGNVSQKLFAAIGAYLSPDEPPLIGR